MKNKISNLNNYLFEQLERLNDDEYFNAENIDKEIARTKAITSVAQTIINNASLVLEAKKFCNDFGLKGDEANKILLLEEVK